MFIVKVVIIKLLRCESMAFLMFCQDLVHPTRQSMGYWPHNVPTISAIDAPIHIYPWTLPENAKVEIVCKFDLSRAQTEARDV